MTDLQGSCLCGKINYNYNSEIIFKAVCHCTDCQKHTSSAYSIIIGVHKKGFNLSGNTIKYFPVKTDTGNIKKYNFCSNCGSHIFSNIEHENYKDMIFIKGGSIDQPKLSDLSPDMEVFTDSKVSWASCGKLSTSFGKNPE